MITFNNVRTALLLSSFPNEYSQSYLFHCARYWADQGDRVMYISKSRVTNLPATINTAEVEYNPDTFSRIRFMYLPRWQDLLQHLYSIHLHPNPVSVIIVQDLDHYCNEEGDSGHDHASLICASIINAAFVCSTRTSKPSYVICDYFSDESFIDMTLIKNYFNNVWQIQNCKVNDEETIKLTKLKWELNKVSEITFSVNSDKSVLSIEQVFKDSLECVDK